MSHEVAHEWFCVSVGNDEYKEAWLDEGFASYCADVLYTSAKPASLVKAAKMDKVKLPSAAKFKSYMDAEAKDQLGKSKHFYINLPVNKFALDDYSFRAYSGGTSFLWKLREAMGDTAFDSAVKEYYATYTLKEATTVDFLNIVRKYADNDTVNSVISTYIK